MSEGPNEKSAPAGWYPHPSMADTQCYWDGQQWTDKVAPAGARTASAASTRQTQQILAVLIIAASIIGVVMSLQSASLLTGTGTQWTGAAIALAASCASFILRKTISVWVRIVAVIAAALALISVIYLEHELDQKRQELGNLAPTVPSVIVPLR